MNIGGTASGALFIGDGETRRPALWRIWDFTKPALFSVGLNPSTAGEDKNDPTIWREICFALSWGYGGLFKGNLFDQVTPYPEELEIGRDQSENDQALREMRKKTPDVLVSWGHFGDMASARVEEVLALLGKPVYCLGKTKDGWPRHPLYMLADTKMKLYERGKL